MGIITALQSHAMDKPATQKLKRDAIAMLREQAQMIVRLEHELEMLWDIEEVMADGGTPC